MHRCPKVTATPIRPSRLAYELRLPHPLDRFGFVPVATRGELGNPTSRLFVGSNQ
jgi:hypothetical protein